MPQAQPVTAATLPQFAGVVDLRLRSDGKLLKRLSYTDALAELTDRRQLEAILRPGGDIKYLRVVDVAPTPKPIATSAPKKQEVYTSRSGAIAQTNLGVYRQEVKATRLAPGLNGTVVVELHVIGHTFAFCMLRGAGM